MFSKTNKLNKMLEKFPVVETEKWTIEKRRNNMSRGVIKDFFGTNYKSTQARNRYLRATLNFIDYIADNTKVHHLDNIKYYHIKEYIQFLLNREKGNGEKLKESYIETEVNGILYYFKLKKINNPKLQKGAKFLIGEVKRDGK